MGKVTSFLAKEIREAIPPTILFLFLFHMVALTKAVVLSDFAIDALRATTATVGALVVAKAIVVVEALAVSRAFAWHRIAHILWRTLLFSIVVLLFRLLEELIPHWIHRDGLGAGIAAMRAEISWPVFWVTMMWLIGGLLLYCIIVEFVEALGGEKAKQLFFGRSGAGAGE